MSGDGVEGGGLIVEVPPPVAVDQAYSYFAPRGRANAVRWLVLAKAATMRQNPIRGIAR
jgi:hypothetical protein